MKKKNLSVSEGHVVVFRRSILTGCLLIYLSVVLWHTIIRRDAGYYPSEFGLFWSYKALFQGQTKYTVPILANFAMFMPFGFLVAAMRDNTQWKTFLLVFVLSFALSALIEVMQLILLRGCFEFDDLFNNVSGAMIGAILFRLIKRFLPEEILKRVLLCISAGMLLFCLGLFLLCDDESGSKRPLSQGLCFQIETAAVMENQLEMSGVCFWYENGPANYTIVLKSTQTEKSYSLQTECGVLRPDVSSYLNINNEKTGFKAICPEIGKNQEYEIFLNFGILRSIATGVYLTVEEGVGTGNVHFVPNAKHKPLDADGTDLADIIAHGILQAYNPENHVYIYMDHNTIYWVAEEGFYFEDDGRTRLELQFRTTEMDKVPKKLWRSDGQYALLGVTFEKNELAGNFGRYRVCAKELPKEYPIISFTTGYYSHGWVWKESFWPMFDFSP